ncbi:hypothetical protein J14TS2_17460 [Bacillus sp. J14TS2]|uniref:DUF2786 domain-containing protein n=1 Tax=Bacillus sp. J14TS2 TaxID=2807188 RepID=UPI001B22C2FB|nr:DUF2786 domain-containing protein [Bacillus sp. J14TS2]GIN71271.1 hypothetical protein J14TS2_17460 [Bacillus sp. J14TS2]
MENRNDAIINKIKGLLAIASDQQNDEESQSAFIMAQKLMIKYDISSGEIEEDKESDSVLEGKVTVYKTLYWWERKLARIISENFRVRFFYNNKVLKGESKTKRAITFLGYEKDVQLAKEMYVLAYDVITFYSKVFIENHYKKSSDYRSRRNTAKLKNSYMRGFLYGLDEKFASQLEEMQQEYGLMVLLPKEVKGTYDEMFKGKKGLSFNIPPIEEIEAYQEGYQDGNRVDYTKSTLGEGVI